MRGRDVIYSAVWCVFGAGIMALMIQLFAKGLPELNPAPHGEVTSSDPVLAGPYGQGQDRWTANELHALNKQVAALLEVLRELKGRLGE